MAGKCSHVGAATGETGAVIGADRRESYNGFTVCFTPQVAQKVEAHANSPVI